VVGLEP